MKKLFILCIIIFLFTVQNPTHAQNFIDETKQWAIVSIPVMEMSLRFTHYYKFSGDSIINGINYHKLYFSDDSNQVNWTFMDLWNEMNDSVFRYCPNCGTISDSLILMYDFNLAVSDTFIFFDDTLVVDSIRIHEWGGSLRKHWYFSEHSGVITWIEGVGQFGLFCCPSPCLNSMIDQLLCFHEYGNLIFQDPNYSGCYIATNINPENKLSNEITIFPNPATNLLYINCEEKATVEIINMQGQIVSAKTLTDKTNSINISNLSPGLYNLRIISKNEIVYRKIVKQ